MKELLCGGGRSRLSRQSASQVATPAARPFQRGAPASIEEGVRSDLVAVRPLAPLYEGMSGDSGLSDRGLRSMPRKRLLCDIIVATVITSSSCFMVSNDYGVPARID